MPESKSAVPTQSVARLPQEKVAATGEGSGAGKTTAQGAQLHKDGSDVGRTVACGGPAARGEPAVGSAAMYREGSSVGECGNAGEEGGVGRTTAQEGQQCKKFIYNLSTI